MTQHRKNEAMSLSTPARATLGRDFSESYLENSIGAKCFRAEDDAIIAERGCRDVGEAPDVVSQFATSHADKTIHVPIVSLFFWLTYVKRHGVSFVQTGP